MRVHDRDDTVQIAWYTDHIMVNLGPDGDEGITVFHAPEVASWVYLTRPAGDGTVGHTRRPDAQTYVHLRGGQTLRFEGEGAWRIDEALSDWTWHHPGANHEPKVETVR